MIDKEILYEQLFSISFILSYILIGTFCMLSLIFLLLQQCFIKKKKILQPMVTYSKLNDVLTVINPNGYVSLKYGIFLFYKIILFLFLILIQISDTRRGR